MTRCVRYASDSWQMERVRTPKEFGRCFRIRLRACVLTCRFRRGLLNLMVRSCGVRVVVLNQSVWFLGIVDRIAKAKALSSGDLGNLDS